MDVRRRWKAAVDAHMDLVDRYAESEGLRLPTQFKHLNQHFEWAVRFQVAADDAITIADDSEVDERSVRRAVGKILKQIGLSQRLAAVGPKPRKTRVLDNISAIVRHNTPRPAAHSVISVEIPVREIDS